MKLIRQTIVDAVANEYMRQHLVKMAKDGNEASTEWSHWCMNNYMFGSIMATVGLGALDENDELVRDISYQIFHKLDERHRCIRHAREALAKEPAQDDCTEDIGEVMEKALEEEN